MTASVWRHIRNFHLPYLAWFQELGWETHVACRGIPDGAPHVDRGIELPFEKRMTAPANFRAAGTLKRLIRAEGYDLIVTHTTLAAFFTRLALAGAFRPSDARRPALVNVMHGYLFDDDTPALKRAVLLGAERLTAPWTDLLLVMNAWDLNLANRYRLGRRVGQIPGMGVDFSRLDAARAEDGQRLRGALGLPEDAFVLLCAAEFSARKSQPVLLRGLKELPENVVLALCGDGATLEECRALAEQLGVAGRTLFPGQVEDMPAWYRMADACVASSRSEGLPFNLMEAMRAGLPVVASAVKGHTDLIDDGVNGLLYPYGDAAALAAAVRRLMADGELRGKIAARAEASVAAYAADVVRPLVMEQYLSALRAERPERAEANGI